MKTVNNFGCKLEYSQNMRGIWIFHFGEENSNKSSSGDIWHHVWNNVSYQTPKSKWNWKLALIFFKTWLFKKNISTRLNSCSEQTTYKRQTFKSVKNILFDSYWTSIIKNYTQHEKGPVKKNKRWKYLILSAWNFAMRKKLNCSVLGKKVWFFFLMSGFYTS